MKSKIDDRLMFIRSSFIQINFDIFSKPGPKIVRLPEVFILNVTSNSDNLKDIDTQFVAILTFEI